jgi:hypothetical protein
VDDQLERLRRRLEWEEPRAEAETRGQVEPAAGRRRGTTTNRGTPSSPGSHDPWPTKQYRTADEVCRRRVERVSALDLDVLDPHDMDTSTFDGRALTQWEQRVLRRVTPDQWQQVHDLATLDRDLHRAELEYLQ